MTFIGMVAVYVWPRSVWSMDGWVSGLCSSDSLEAFRSVGCGSPFTVSPVAGTSVSTVFA